MKIDLAVEIFVMSGFKAENVPVSSLQFSLQARQGHLLRDVGGVGGIGLGSEESWCFVALQATWILGSAVEA